VRIDDYLDPAPQGVRGFDIPFQHFLHQDVFDVAGHPYAVRLVRTTQPASGPDPQSFGIIIDIDVFTTRPSEPTRESIESRLNEMRWLKPASAAPGSTRFFDAADAEPVGPISMLSAPVCPREQHCPLGRPD
jgi:hypothetical protein